MRTLAAFLAALIIPAPALAFDGALQDHYRREAANPDHPHPPSPLLTRAFESVMAFDEQFSPNSSIRITDGAGWRSVHLVEIGEHKRIVLLNLHETNRWHVTGDEPATVSPDAILFGTEPGWTCHLNGRPYTLQAFGLGEQDADGQYRAQQAWLLDPMSRPIPAPGADFICRETSQ